MTTKFKVGDKVMRVQCDNSLTNIGDLFTVSYFDGNYIKLREYPKVSFHSCYFKLQSELPTHAAVALHYYTGGQIEVSYDGGNTWVLWNSDVNGSPIFNKSCRFRKYVPPVKSQSEIKAEELEKKAEELLESAKALRKSL